MLRLWRRCGRRGWWADAGASATGAAIAPLQRQAVAAPCMQKACIKMLKCHCPTLASSNRIDSSDYTAFRDRSACGWASSFGITRPVRFAPLTRKAPQQEHLHRSLQAIVQASISSGFGNTPTSQLHQRYAGLHEKFIPVCFCSPWHSKPAGRRVAALFLKRCTVAARMYPPCFAAYI